MTLPVARALAIAMAAACLATMVCAAQAPTQGQRPATPSTPQNQPQGQVIFSRSISENGKTTTQSTVPSAALAQSAPSPVAVDDAERKAITFTSLDLEVHLGPVDQHIAVRALVTVRNAGKSPLSCIPVQISSSLNWDRIRVEGKDIAFQTATLNSDADHTGQLHEAAVPLSTPLAPGQSLHLDLTYSGKIVLSAQRLHAVGAPDDAALHADWDQISLPFTGLRGFGNVVWYPVSSVPVVLGDGARLFDEIGEHKLRLASAHFRLRLAVEFPHGQAPTVALINGFPVPLTVTEPAASLDMTKEVDGVATADSGGRVLGFEAPSLFVAIRNPHPGPNLTAYTLPDDNVSIDFWTTAAKAVTPLLQAWLGQKPRSQLTLLDLPDLEDAPFETGSLLAIPLREPGPMAKPGVLEGELVHALTHAWITSPDSRRPLPAWLNEGLATFMGTLWVEKEQGREQALRTLEAGRAALALAEPASPGESAGQPLAQAISPIYYRTKAAYVLWMLRNLVGDAALSDALRAYDSSPNVTAPAPNKGSGTPAARSDFEKLLEETATAPDLSWFFADWVDADKGLPDLSIQSVFPTTVSVGNWLVAVRVSNTGYATADVPVIVRSGSGADARSVAQRVRVPGRESVTTRILIQGKPAEVQVNDGSVPETQASVHVTHLDAR